MPSGSATPDGLFVGRTREIDELSRALASAEAGAGRLVLITGDAGIGKTRLAEQVAQEAELRGARVIVGRCHEGEGAPSYWPWVLALRALVRLVERERLVLPDALLAVIGQVVPEIAPAGTPDPPAPALDATAARFRFFDAVTTLLGHATAHRPLVLLLDDLHWADGASLHLLIFAARQLARERVLLVGTLRPGEMRSAADTAVRAELARAGQQLDLGGLALPDVSRMLRSILGADPPVAVAARIHQATDGNPFFVDAMGRVLASTDGLDDASADVAALPIPDGVRAVIRARMRPLGDATQRLLARAALLGRDFTPTVLARVAEVDVAAVTAALDEAERCGLLGVEAGASGRRRFAHALIGETLAGDLPALERARLHARIADVLEPLLATGGATLDEVAAHRFAAAPVEGVDKAIDHARRAAERASARLGYEDAVRHYRRAVAFLDASADVDLRRRAEILLALGEAERRVGDAAAARATLARAATLAREAGHATVLAGAALAFGAGLGGFWDQSAGVVDDERVAFVQDALVALGDGPSGMRAMLLAHLAGALFWSTSLERRARVEQLSREAVAMATAVPEPSVRLQVLATAHWTTWGPDDPDGRLRAAEELVQLATVAGESEVLLRARMYVAAHHLEGGDGAAADREVERFADLAGDLRQQRQGWYAHVYRGVRAYLAGRFADVERIATQALALGESAQPAAARMAFGAQLTMLHREQGRAAETIAATREIARAAPGIPAWSCALASGLAEAGDLASARHELARLAADGCSILQRNFFWLYGMAHLSRACAALDDEAHATALYELLAPYADQAAVAQHGVISDGAVARHLGMLATVLHRWDDAERHFATALDVNTRLGARIFVTATRHDHARMLLRRGAGGDTQAAREMLAAAAAEASELGQSALLERIAALSGTGGGWSVAAEPAQEDRCALERDAAGWLIRHRGRRFSIKDAVGVGYLIVLLRSPGHEIHARALVGGPGALAPAARGDAGEMLDAQARSSYRARLAELRTDLEQVEELNDVGRAEGVRAEIAALTDELARAVGLGGRPRRASSDDERARINVTRALRRVIDAITEQDPALGSDLERGVRTGVFCSYTPDPRMPIRWQV